jgi:hypothetical protein
MQEHVPAEVRLDLFFSMQADNAHGMQSIEDSVVSAIVMKKWGPEAPSVSELPAESHRTYDNNAPFRKPFQSPPLPNFRA